VTAFSNPRDLGSTSFATRRQINPEEQQHKSNPCSSANDSPKKIQASAALPTGSPSVTTAMKVAETCFSDQLYEVCPRNCGPSAMPRAIEVGGAGVAAEFGAARLAGEQEEEGGAAVGEPDVGR
jgi:hypothetical protein